MFFYIMVEFLESLFIIILFGYLAYFKLISVSCALSNNIWVVSS